MIAFVELWGHALLAVLFGSLSLWLIARQAEGKESQAFAIACALTALWGLATAMGGYGGLSGLVFEHARDAGWLWFMYQLWRLDEGRGRTSAAATVYASIAGVIGASLIVSILPGAMGAEPHVIETARVVSTVLRMVMAAGALVLLHNLYLAAPRVARDALRLPLIGLAAYWVYELNLFAMVQLTRDWHSELFALRGLAMSLLAPLFALGARQSANWQVKLSRRMTFQSLGLAAIGGYLAVMVLVVSLFDIVGGDTARIAKVAFVFMSSVAALAILPSQKFRAWMHVKLAKHLFQHRYDYRSEWMRFTATIGRPGDDAEPLEARIVKAIADITQSPGGLLLVPDPSGALLSRARWNWQLDDPPAIAAGHEVTDFFAKSGRVIELDAIRGESGSASEDARYVPEWIVADQLAWVIVPLVHFDRLAGLVVLCRPVLSRSLDWEDFDLLKVAGSQVASYLSEAHGQEVLAEAMRFEEFNRRFAFIMHDIKNLVSQLGLVTRNAEKHIGNPDFQADLIATLKSSTDRMNGLLARLSQHNNARSLPTQLVSPYAIAENIAAARRATHPVVLAGDNGLLVSVDPARLEQAMGHLVQNAIEASAPHEPVTVSISRQGGQVAIEVIDTGCGMSAEFMREKLFKPFVSTKAGGFGIGAFEARGLISGIGGQLDVVSREGKGSRFTILLPMARGFGDDGETSEAKVA